MVKLIFLTSIFLVSSLTGTHNAHAKSIMFYSLDWVIVFVAYDSSHTLKTSRVYYQIPPEVSFHSTKSSCSEFYCKLVCSLISWVTLNPLKHSYVNFKYFSIYHSAFTLWVQTEPIAFQVRFQRRGGYFSDMLLTIHSMGKNQFFSIS